jgi:hypothetical protein
VNDHLTNPDVFDADAGIDAYDPAPGDELEYEEADGVETDVEVEMLVARMQATRFSGA